MASLAPLAFVVASAEQFAMASCIRLVCRSGLVDESFWGRRCRRGGLQRPALSARAVLGLVSVVRVRASGSFCGYAEDVWTRRREIYAGLSRSKDLYSALRERACVCGLAATQVLLDLWLALCVALLSLSLCLSLCLSLS